MTIKPEVQEWIHSTDKEVEEECKKLTPFGTITRYPGSTMQPEADHMPLVTKWMDAVRDRVRKCLSIDG